MRPLLRAAYAALAFAVVLAVSIPACAPDPVARHEPCGQLAPADCPPGKVIAFASFVPAPLLAQAPSEAAPTISAVDPEQIGAWLGSGQYVLAGAALLALLVKILSGLSSGWFATRWGKLTLVGLGALLGTLVDTLVLGSALGSALVTAAVQALLAIGAYSAGKNLLQGNRAALLVMLGAGAAGSSWSAGPGASMESTGGTTSASVADPRR